MLARSRYEQHGVYSLDVRPSLHSYERHFGPPSSPDSLKGVYINGLISCLYYYELLASEHLPPPTLTYRLALCLTR